MSKRTFDQQSMARALAGTSVDLRLNHVEEMLKQMTRVIIDNLGEDFTDEYLACFTLVTGLKVLSDPDNPLMQTCKAQSSSIEELSEQVNELTSEVAALKAHNKLLAAALSDVRKALKCEELKGSSEAARELQDKKNPSRLEEIIISYERALKDVLVRIKGIC